MKSSELREKTVEELRELEKSLQRDLWKTRFDNYTNRLDNTALIRRLRRDVARVKTLLTQQADEQANKAEG